MKNRNALQIIAALLVLAGTTFLMRTRMTSTVPVAPVFTPITQQPLSHGRFDSFTVYVPHGSPRGFVLLLSGSDGWSVAMDEMARHIASDGALVAGLDAAKFNAVLEHDGGQCVYPDGDLENLSHFVQAYFHLPTYLPPILAGAGAGGTLAYATLVQAPAHTFGAAVSVNFCPNLALNKPLCKGDGIEFTPRVPGPGVDFLPAHTHQAWTVVQQEALSAGEVCDLDAVRNFVGAVPGATLATQPNALATVIADLVTQNTPATADAIPSELADLPLVTVAARAGTAPALANSFALILSGDGGWAGLDKDVAGALSDSGIPVIGLDSLRYFWSARTPSGLAADIDRIVHYYTTHLGKQRVLLIGYSQGADVLPFAVNHLAASTRSAVALTAVMGMSEHALFEFHVTGWVSDDNSGPATLPEVDKIVGIPVLCIYGQDESDTLCPKLDAHKATVVKLKGGHHFDGNYANLAHIILSAAAPR